MTHSEILSIIRFVLSDAFARLFKSLRVQRQRINDLEKRVSELEGLQLNLLDAAQAIQKESDAFEYEDERDDETKRA